jgi:hypothetical protein
MEVRLQKELPGVIAGGSMLWFKRPKAQPEEEEVVNDEADVEEGDPKPVMKPIKAQEVGRIRRAFSEEDLLRFEKQDEEDEESA